MVKVENMINDKENATANQFVMEDDIVQITLNIGLNVRGQEPPGQEEETLELVQPLWWYIGKGVDESTTERTVVCVINISKNKIKPLLEQYCKLLNQICIAYGENENYGLVFNPEYSGRKYKYDKNKFLSITRTGGTKI